MRKILFISLIYILGFCQISFAANRYIAPSGTDSGDCTNDGSPCNTFSYIQGQASAGDTIYLQDGTYTNSNSGMLTATKSGSNGSPIVFRAVNDGSVLINGEDAYRPIDINGFDYIDIHGIHAYNSIYDVVRVRDANYINLYRVTANEADNGDSADNYHDFTIYISSNVLLEDCAGWGTARNILIVYHSNNITVRRFWGGYHSKGNSIHGPVISQIYDSHDVLYENVIGTNIDFTGSNLAGIWVWDNDTSGDVYNVDVLGSVMYDLETTGLGYRYPSFGSNSKTGNTFQMTGVSFDNIVSINEPSGLNLMYGDNTTVDHATVVDSSIGAIQFESAEAPDLTSYLNITNSILMDSVCGVHNTVDTPDTFLHTYNDYYNDTTDFCYDGPASTGEFDTNPSFDTSTYGYGAYLIQPSALDGLGSAAGNVGAEVLYRYEDGVLSDTPLWPWPMEGRILAESGFSPTYSTNQGNGETGGIWKTLAGVYLAVTGTVTTGLGGGNISESQVVAGGKTIIYTLADDTWVATLGADNAITDAFIAGITCTSAVQTHGFAAEVAPTITYDDFSRDSDTQLTLTLDAAASYDIDSNETWHTVVPATAVTSATEITASPDITISYTEPPASGAGLSHNSTGRTYSHSSTGKTITVGQ